MRRLGRFRICALVVVFAAAVCWASSARAAAPNILLITADNLGYGDLRCYNAHSEIVTPEIDKLAAEGVRLTNFYTASSTCTVSRACLLTGRVAQRHRLVDQLGGVKGNYGVGLRHSEVLLPALLKRAKTPYATGCFGKWNIGFAKGSRPTERGFDEFIGHASGNLDYYRHNYREQHDLFEGTKPLDRKGEYSTDIFADAACEFIARRSGEAAPWFCYVPFNAPHFPVAGNKPPGEANRWQAPDGAFAPYAWEPEVEDPRKRYCAVVTALDTAIGRLLRAVDDAGVRQNTLVFFMSDNGAFRLNRMGLDVGSNWPLRHGGVTCWEGGVRVAAIARFPQAQDQAGTAVEQPTWSPDVLSACLELAGVSLPKGLVIDGRNPLPVWFGKAVSPHRSFYFEYRRHAALRMGNWKIVREKPAQPWQLFDLATDPGEQRNSAKTHPQRVAALAQEFAAWRTAIAKETTAN